MVVRGYNRLTLEVGADITPDKWIKGGHGTYTIALERDGRRLHGTFTGQYNGREVSGTASGEIYDGALRAAPSRLRAEG